MQQRKEVDLKKSQYNVEYEKNQLKTHGENLDFIIPQNFIDQITTGDIIEIYSPPPENRQLYANAEFLKICSYTLEQMNTIPFPDLFWREPEFNELLFKRAANVVTTENEAVPWNLPQHELIESLHPRKRTFIMNMGIIAPCFSKTQPTKRVGWASTLQVELVFEWSEDL